jgi:hypothetical protein
MSPPQRLSTKSEAREDEEGEEEKTKSSSLALFLDSNASASAIIRSLGTSPSGVIILILMACDKRNREKGDGKRM